MGISLGNRAASYLRTIGSSGTSLLHEALYVHPIDRYFSTRPFFATSLAVVVPIVAMVDPEVSSGAVIGGDDGGNSGDFTWKYEKRWSSSGDDVQGGEGRTQVGKHDEMGDALPSPHEEDKQRKDRRDTDGDGGGGV